MSGHPVGLRIRAVAAHEAGEGSYATIATRFAVGEASVKRWVWRFRSRGSVAPYPNRGGRRSTISAEEISAILRRIGDANAGEITAEFNRGRRGRQRVHVSSVKRALYRHGYVVKKNESGRWSSSGQTSRQGAAGSSARSVASTRAGSSFSTSRAFTSR